VSSVDKTFGRRAALVLLVVCAIAQIAFALTLSPDDEAARNVAFQWLQVVDSGNYRDATLLIAEHARGSQDWLNYFAAHRTPLGQVKNRQVVEVKHASTIPGDPELRQHDIIRFKTSFEHKLGALEEVVMTKMGCCWEVSGYKIFKSQPDGR
jgi:hypothetical protein